MKHIKTLAVMTLIGLTASSSAVAQRAPGQRPADAPQRPPAVERPTDGAAAATHFANVFATVAPFDVNHDGQLDDAEKAALAQAVADGRVQPPAHRTPPPGVTPDAGMILGRVAMLYSRVAPFDADHDGVLSEAELAALKAAIENGTSGRPGGRRGGRPRG